MIFAFEGNHPFLSIFNVVISNAVRSCVFANVCARACALEHPIISLSGCFQEVHGQTSSSCLGRRLLAPLLDSILEDTLGRLRHQNLWTNDTEEFLLS